MAQTPWGELPVSDAHVHFFSHNFYSGLARQKRAANAESLAMLLDWQIPPADPQFLSRSWVEELDRHAIKRACLIASAPGDEASVATAVSLYPDRFFGFFMVDPLQSDALNRVKAAAANPHLHCLCLFPAMHTYSVTDGSAGLHTRSRFGCGISRFRSLRGNQRRRTKKVGLPSQFDMRYSNPLDVHPVALHFPQIRFIVPHFGAGLFREALNAGRSVSECVSRVRQAAIGGWGYEGLDLRMPMSM